MPLHTGGIGKVSPTLICLNTDEYITLGKKCRACIHALCHSLHIPSSAAVWRNMSHAFDTSSRLFLVLGCFLDPVLSFACSRWILHLVLLWCFWCISYLCSLRSNSNQKASFPTPLLKSRDRWKKQLQKIFLSFWEQCTKDRLRVLIQTHEEQHLVKLESFHGESLQELGTDRGAHGLWCAGVNRAWPCSSAVLATSGTSFAAACGSGREFLYRVSWVH